MIGVVGMLDDLEPHGPIALIQLEACLWIGNYFLKALTFELVWRTIISQRWVQVNATQIPQLDR